MYIDLKGAPMKVVCFGPHARIGALIGGDLVLDLNMAFAACAHHQDGDPRPYAKADANLPANLADFLNAGRPAIEAAKSIIAWQAKSGKGIEGPAGEKVVAKRSELKILAPLPSMSSRIFCGGGNYVRHLSGVRKLWKGQHLSDEEWTRFIREKPFWGFYKLPQTVVGPDAPVTIPNWVQAFDYELEIAAYIGKRGKNVSREEAREMIVGYACFNDWCIRDPHLVIGAQDFDEGVLSFAFQKNASGASLGPYLAIDEFKDPYALRMETKVNGSNRQSGITGEMIFKLDEIVAYLSKYLTLYPGDIITPGTCAGTAFDSSRLLPESEWKPGKLRVDSALFLKDKDLVEAGIEGLGVLRNTMVAEPSRNDFDRVTR
jgi:2-keto-4-pentenoate hydratase/2-oxohepta-3-ene-1,7-dioic acid hydratase in catechol pathway